MNKTTPVLESKNLQVKMGGALILDVPSLSVTEGEILSLIGPNGAGKTTLLQAMSHLIPFSRGEVYLNGSKIGSNHSVIQYRRKIAMVFQEPLLFDTTVVENVASGLRIRGIKGPEIRDIASAQLARFGIAHLADRSAKTLSGGEAQRTSLARAFATRPEILFLDEPFASLDPPTRESIIDDLERVLRETGTTTVMATHDRLEAIRLSDRIAVMNGGRIVQAGTPEEVMNHPADEWIASFVGTETILSGKVAGKNGSALLISAFGRNLEAVGEAVPGEDVVLCIRPENVTLSESRPASATSARNVFPGTVERIIPSGAIYKVRIDCGFPLTAYVTRNAIDDLSLREGLPVTSSFKATAIHVIRRKSPFYP
jgi:tungstate transport system ATP-binding protein